MSESLVDTLIRHEGLRLYPYRDTVGKLTIGVGRNLDDVGITEAEARQLLLNDINRTQQELKHSFSWFQDLDPVRKDVLINMTFNMGLTRLRRFRKMLAALEQGDYAKASQEMLDSRWATQVKGRALELAQIMERGEE